MPVSYTNETKIFVHGVLLTRESRAAMPWLTGFSAAATHADWHVKELAYDHQREDMKAGAKCSDWQNCKQLTHNNLLTWHWSTLISPAGLRAHYLRCWLLTFNMSLSLWCAVCEVDLRATLSTLFWCVSWQVFLSPTQKKGRTERQRMPRELEHRKCLNIFHDIQYAFVSHWPKSWENAAESFLSLSPSIKVFFQFCVRLSLESIAVVSTESNDNERSFIVFSIYGPWWITIWWEIIQSPNESSAISAWYENEFPSLLVGNSFMHFTFYVKKSWPAAKSYICHFCAIKAVNVVCMAIALLLPSFVVNSTLSISTRHDKWIFDQRANKLRKWSPH